MRWLVLLCLLAAPVRAQDRDVAAVLTFGIERAGIVTRQETRVDGCAVTVTVFEAVVGREPRYDGSLTLWLGDWILADVAADPHMAEMAALHLVARYPPAPHEAALYAAAMATMEDHLAAAVASGLAVERYFEEVNRMAEEIARRGMAGEFGAVAARNHVERVLHHPGGVNEYAWAPLDTVAIEVPADRAGEAMAALAALQARACS